MNKMQKQKNVKLKSNLFKILEQDKKKHECLFRVTHHSQQRVKKMLKTCVWATTVYASKKTEV